MLMPPTSSGWLVRLIASRMHSTSTSALPTLCPPKVDLLRTEFAATASVVSGAVPLALVIDVTMPLPFQAPALRPLRS